MVLAADLVVLPFVGRVSVVSKPVRVGSISLPVFVTSAPANSVTLEVLVAAVGVFHSPVLILRLSWFFCLFSSTVCLLFWILVLWFVFRSVEICRDQSFQFCICSVREFGKAGDSGFG
jgi:hypothetical protein